MFGVRRLFASSGFRQASRNSTFARMAGANTYPAFATSSRSFGSIFENTMFSKPIKDKKESGSDKNDEENPFQDFMKKNPQGYNIAGALLCILGAAGIASYLSATEYEEITFQDFQNNYLSRGLVKSVDIVNERIARVDLVYPPAKPIFFRIGNADRVEERIESYQRNLGIDPSQFIPVKMIEETSTSEYVAPFVYSVLPIFILVGLLYAMQKKMPNGGIMGNIQKASYFDASSSTVRFKDVAGCDEAKKEIMEFVEFLKEPEKFHALGARCPKGALLVGPPGTGKTLLAKAVAGEAGRPFFAMSGADFMEMYVGVGASRVRDLFKQARAKAPCIIFIDEIDAVGGKRDGGGRNNSEKDATLNQLLVEMDGMKSSENIVVLAATNRADMLDKALTRPGRFDRQVSVDKPDLEGRVAIFHEHLINKKLSTELNSTELTKRLASLTPGMVGADIANICNEAAIYAARRGATAIERDDFENAIDRVMGGLKKAKSAMNNKRTVAYHEAGHCVAGWFLEHADPVVKVSIVPRTSGALGFAQYLPEENSLMTKEKILDRICMTLGGRAAEEIFIGKITTGASDDLDKVTQYARSIVSIYGMYPESIGLVSYPKQDEMYQKPYSEAKAQDIDRVVKEIIDAEYIRVKKILNDNYHKLDALAVRLLEKENVAQKDIIECLGPRPFEVREDLKMYLM